MNLWYLYKLLDNNKEFNSLISSLSSGQKIRNRISVPDSAKPFFISAILHKINTPVLLLTCDAEKAQKLFLSLNSWIEDKSRINLYPDKTIFNFKEDSITSEERLKVLSLLFSYRQDKRRYENSPLIVSSLMSAATGIISRQKFEKLKLSLTTGMIVDMDSVIEKCLDAGYENDNIVELPGYITRRGGILDIFPVNSDLPVRLEFEGRRIESMRLFDAGTQRTIRIIDSIEIVSRNDTEDAHTESSTLFDYLSEDTTIILDDYEQLKSSYEEYLDYIINTGNLNQDHNEEPSNKFIPVLNWEEITARIVTFKCHMEIHLWNLEDAGVSEAHDVIFSPVLKFGGRLDSFIQDLKRKMDTGCSILIVSQQEQRLSELLYENNIHLHHKDKIEFLPMPGTVLIVKGLLSEGWTYKDNFLLITDNEIFGWVKQERSVKKRPIRHHLFLNQLNTDDYVVHIDHGIGKFIGFSKLQNNGVETEYILLEYAAGDKLYVPVEQIDRLSRYIGSNEKLPSLSRLHTQEWAQVKARIKRSVHEIAAELLNLYAAREMVNGFAFSPDTIWQRELESSFPYMETTDQLKAVAEVKADMENDKPMDRLICGDVGYGKTEIALRAAFKAVMDNKQVALLVPTTVLAQQHYLTFRNRLLAFPVRLEVLSRFTSEKEQKQIIEGLANGSVDICIGTHRLLQKDIQFKDIGLLIVDEEQRFGVAHKEFFKRLRKEIDVLTLSATPIPRTLHMSLAGIKDLSTLETPPEDRLPIKTYAGPYNTGIIRDAVLREIERRGQVFYVHNRINDIHRLEYELHQMLPDARISVGHGQMNEDDLEVIMTNFVEGKTDILLTTTIIESGIDIPNVNTMVIDESDKLGLTQLYQLRGRIGRGTNNAFAYFFYRNGKHLSDQAVKRLKTITEATELGAGFAIAMKDLEIRGAGNLLGIEQSGYISAVGFDLYCRLLAEAVEEIRHRDSSSLNTTVLNDANPVQISLSIDAYIPENYILAESERIFYYQKIASSTNSTDFEEIEKELADRYGDMPQQVSNIIYVGKLRQYARRAKIESIVQNKHEISIWLNESINQKSSAIQGFVSKYRDIIEIGNRQIKIQLNKTGNKWRKILEELLKILTLN